MPAPEEIAACFPLSHKLTRIEPLKRGHINDTYKLYLEGGDEPEYILQRINDQIFKDIPGILENIENVDSFLRSKSNSGIQWPMLVYTQNGKNHVRDKEEKYWRCYRYIKGSRSYDTPPRPEYAREAGKIIGEFHAELSGFTGRLNITIPRFHDFDLRWQQFNESIGTNFEQRAGNAEKLIDQVHELKGFMESYFHSFTASGIPLRIVHYDTKFNNILFDDSGIAISLIDLDTLMPGYIQFDYGDALRTLSCTTVEDEQDITMVAFDKTLFTSFTRGYFNCVKGILSSGEVDSFILAPSYLTYIIGLRFLTDYLNGDTYFRVSYGSHNLVRARNQLKMVDWMMENELFIRETIYNSF
jgi:Ser/Thr protein kinase RdoA (MazF antagonist)